MGIKVTDSELRALIRDVTTKEEALSRLEKSQKIRYFEPKPRTEDVFYTDIAKELIQTARELGASDNEISDALRRGNIAGTMLSGKREH